MSEYLQQAVSEVRRLAASGDFTGARRRLTQYVEAEPETPGANVVALDEQRRTLEVLESLEVIRRLLREGKVDSASQAADGIREALSSHEYSRLGVLGAALALLDRAGELARRAVAGDESSTLKAELDAFVTHLGGELRQLQAEQVDGRLHLLTQPGRVTSTLGDLLSRRAGAAPMMPMIEAQQAAPSARGAAAPAQASTGDGPVIGRILVAQEQQERVAPAPQTVTAPGHVDMFDLVGSSALRYWHILAGLALGLAAVGYLAVAGMPQKYSSRAVLQRSTQPAVSAPNLGNPGDIVKPVLFQTVLHMATSEDFNQRVSRRLQQVGWADGEGESATYTLTSGDVARGLTSTGENPGTEGYLIKFHAVATDDRTCQALVGAACDEIRAWYFQQRTADMERQIQVYTRYLEEARAGLDRINARRLTEFTFKDTTSVGVSIQDRIDQMMGDLRKATADLQSERINLIAAMQEEDALKEIAERIPPFEDLPPDARLEALKKFCADLEKEHLELARKRDEYGPEHPIQKRIKGLQEDLNLAEKEVEELERTKEADVEKRKPNPYRTAADSRVVEAQARTSTIRLRITSLELAIPGLQDELGRLSEQYVASLDLRRQEEGLQRDRDKYQRTLDDLANVRAAAARELDVYVAPTRGTPVARQELVGIAVGLVAGLVIGIGVAIALTRRRQFAEGEAMA